MSVLSWKPIASAVAVGLVAAVAYLLLADDRYEAEAMLLVVPLPAGDATFAGFALPRASDGASPAETIADLVERPPVVDAAATRLRLDRDDVLDAISVDAEDSSNVVTVRAESGDASRAAQLANAVVDEFVAERSSVFQGEVNRTIEELRDALRNVPASEREPETVARLAALQAELGEPDPTIRVAGNAVGSEDPTGPSPLAVVGAGLGAGLALGLALAALGGPRPPPRTPGEAEVARREALLAERIKAVTARERAVAKRVGELAKQERASQEQRPEPDQAPHPEPETVAAAPLLHEAPWNVLTLERLVAERGDEFPDRVEEWRSYLFFLRDHATPEGTLPPSFDALVDETFGELFEA